MSDHWRRLFSDCVAVALITMSVIGCEGHAGDSAGLSAKPSAEQVAELDGPFVSADFVVDRETNSPRLVTCAKDGVIRMFDLRGQQQETWKIDDSIGQVVRFAVSSQADAYAAMADSGVVVFGRFSRANTVARGTAKSQYLRLAFSNDGKLVAAFSTSEGQVWSCDDWTERLAVTSEKGTAESIKEALAFLKEGDQVRIATAGFQSTAIEVLSVPSGNLDRTLQGDERLDRKFEDLASTPDSKYLIAATIASDRLAVFDVASGKVVARPPAFSTGIGNRLAISADGKTVACSHYLRSSRSRPSFRVFRVDGWIEIGRFEAEHDAEEIKKLRVSNLAIDSTGATVATLHEGGQIRIWKLPSK